MASMRGGCLLLPLIFATIAVLQPGGEAQLGSAIISGIVRCSIGTVAGAGSGSAPGFPNATVLLKCGSQVTASTTTTIAGAFRLRLSNVLSGLIDTLLNDCVMAVVTPLADCDQRLPSSGMLLAPLQLLRGSLLGGLLGNIGVGDFTYSP